MALVALFLVFLALLRPPPSLASGQVKSNPQILREGAPVGMRLALVQAAFRHGARTSLAPAYFPNVTWEHCDSNYAAPGDLRSVVLVDENGGTAPHLIDTVGGALRSTPELGAVLPGTAF